MNEEIDRLAQNYQIMQQQELNRKMGSLLRQARTPVQVAAGSDHSAEIDELYALAEYLHENIIATQAAMKIPHIIWCEHCDKKITIPASLETKQYGCPVCKKAFTYP